MPGRLRSSVYLPAPVVLPAASTMAIDFPITEKLFISNQQLAFSTQLNRLFCRKKVTLLLCSDQLFALARFFGLNHRSHRLVHLRIAGAAAKITAERLANLMLGWVGIVGHQRPYRHNE